MNEHPGPFKFSYTILCSLSCVTVNTGTFVFPGPSINGQEMLTILGYTYSSVPGELFSKNTFQFLFPT